MTANANIISIVIMKRGANINMRSTYILDWIVCRIILFEVQYLVVPYTSTYASDISCELSIGL